MRVALILIVALACVAIASAGSGKKDKKYKGGKENKEAWDSKKNYKNKEGKTNEGEKKRSKRDETEQQNKEQKKTKDQNRKHKQESKNQAAEEGQNQDQEPIKKKSKKVENVQKTKEEWSKKNKGKKEEKLIKKEEKVQKKVEPVEEDVVIETVEETQSTQESETIEAVEGECSEEPSEECAQEEPEVTLATGAKVKGKNGKSKEGKDTAEFTGVPYAEPPQGQDRLKEPVLKEWWPGVLEAKSPGSDCLQYSHFTYSVIGSEDCLYLNVYTPRSAVEKNNTNLLPVVVYIHGGAFMFFSAKVGGPKYFLDKDMILVTLNYRLGPLGFFTLGDESVPGNLGLRDQTTALKWVQRNIKSFGGDPSRVTIAGMSAGGASVHYHMLSPLSRGLFSKAISISGVSLNPWAEAENLVDKSKDLARRMGCNSGTSETIVSCLRSRTAEQIVATAKDLQVWQYNPISPWAPSPEPKTASNPFLPDFPMNIILEGKSYDVPWLVSWTNQEGGYPGGEFIFDSTAKQHLEKNWDDLLPHLLEYNFTACSTRYKDISNKIKQFYLKGKSADNPASAQGIIDMLSDRLFLEGIGEAIKSHAKTYNSPIFTYRFSHVGQDSVAKHMCHCQQKLAGACHADDIGYIIEALSPVLSTQEEFNISKNMVNLWYTFITTGEPKFGDVVLPKVLPGQDSIPFLDIQQGGSTMLTSQKDLGNQEFWTSLGLKDLLLRSAQSSENTRTREEL